MPSLPWDRHGGIPNMITHNETGLLYRFEEPEHLAAHIIALFNDKQLCQKLSQAGRETAAERHNPQWNAHVLLKIYQSLNNSEYDDV
jgi:glycosyltransferase involved in cell wall biosynthesis